MKKNSFKNIAKLIAKEFNIDSDFDNVKSNMQIYKEEINYNSAARNEAKIAGKYKVPVNYLSLVEKYYITMFLTTVFRKWSN